MIVIDYAYFTIMGVEHGAMQNLINGMSKCACAL